MVQYKSTTFFLFRISQKNARTIVYRMIQKYRHIIVAFLLLNLIVPTIGVSAHSLYCACTQREKISFFPPQSTCNADASQVCCQSETSTDVSHLKPCCQKFTKLKQSFAKAHNCTHKSVKYYKANLTFESIGYSKFIDYQWIVNDFTFVKYRFLPVFHTFPIVFMQQHKVPPPLLCLDRLSWIQTYRC